jgi:hypothetical protein
MGERRTSDHCVDCCCARAWKALGIAEYTGKSIPEHISELRQQLAESERLRGLVNDTCASLELRFIDQKRVISRLEKTIERYEAQAQSEGAPEPPKAPTVTSSGTLLWDIRDILSRQSRTEAAEAIRQADHAGEKQADHAGEKKEPA